MPWEIIGESVGGEVKYSHSTAGCRSGGGGDARYLTCIPMCGDEGSKGGEGDSAMREQSQRFHCLCRVGGTSSATCIIPLACSRAKGCVIPPSRLLMRAHATYPQTFSRQHDLYLREREKTCLRADSHIQRERGREHNCRRQI